MPPLPPLDVAPVPPLDVAPVPPFDAPPPFDPSESVLPPHAALSPKLTRVIAARNEKRAVVRICAFMFTHKAPGGHSMPLDAAETPT
jgi:hypothetical protein